MPAINSRIILFKSNLKAMINHLCLSGENRKRSGLKSQTFINQQSSTVPNEIVLVWIIRINGATHIRNSLSSKFVRETMCLKSWNAVLPQTDPETISIDWRCVLLGKNCHLLYIGGTAGINLCWTLEILVVKSH